MQAGPLSDYLNIGVWRGLPIHDGQTVNFTAVSDNGFASRCSEQNKCERADSGEITLNTYKEGTSAWAHYKLRFKGGEVLSGKSDVKWCEFREFRG